MKLEWVQAASPAKAALYDDLDKALMQTSLFEQPTDPDFSLDHVLGNGTLREYPQAFPPRQVVAYLEDLVATIPWRQEQLRIAGKMRPVPRLQCWMGDRESHYGYSGMRLQPVPWAQSVLAIRSRVQHLAGVEFNSVLLNYYRNGQDSVAWHADDEKELGPDPIIASVSLGAERLFQLKPKRQVDNMASFKLNLRSGSVLIMGKGLQSNWLHQLPKVKGLLTPRINLTFRRIL